MLKIDYEAQASASAFVDIVMTGYSMTQIELDAIDQAAGFFQCSADEVVLVAPPRFHVQERRGVEPFEPIVWQGQFQLALVSAERNHLVVNRSGEDGDDED